METAKRNMIEQLRQKYRWKYDFPDMAKSGDDGQEALAQLCVMKIFIKLVQTGSQLIYGSNYTPFCLSQSCFGRENELQSWNPTF